MTSCLARDMAILRVFWARTVPETLKFAKSQALAPARGWGPKKFFLRQKPLFFKPGPPKKCFGTFLKKKSMFRKVFEKIAAAGGPQGPEKPKWSKKSGQKWFIGPSDPLKWS